MALSTEPALGRARRIVVICKAAVSALSEGATKWLWWPEGASDDQGSLPACAVFPGEPGDRGLPPPSKTCVSSERRGQCLQLTEVSALHLPFCFVTQRRDQGDLPPYVEMNSEWLTDLNIKW